MSKLFSSISIIIPALNEEHGIGRTVQSVPTKELQSSGYDVQILVIDNGSTDRTGEIARQAGADVIFESRRGYGRAYKTGFANAKGDIIATADADLTYPVEDIPHMVGLLQSENLDFITTNRFAGLEPHAMAFSHKVGNKILNTATRLLFGIKVLDCQSGMWIFRRNLLEKLILKSDGMPLSEELKIEAGYYCKCRWKEIPISYRPRVGQVKLRFWKDGVQNLFYLVEKRISR